MTATEKQIKLAEAMGWELVNYPNAGPMWRQCDCHWIRYKAPPDPFTDANACNALIKHLNGMGIVVNIEHHTNGVADVAFRSSDNSEWWDECDNWMHGVCELALKVIE